MFIDFHSFFRISLNLLSFFFLFPYLRIIAIGYAPRGTSSALLRAQSISSCWIFAIKQFGVVSMVLHFVFLFLIYLFLSALFVEHLGVFLLSGQLSLFLTVFFYFNFLFCSSSWKSVLSCVNRSCFSVNIWFNKNIWGFR